MNLVITGNSNNNTNNNGERPKRSGHMMKIQGEYPIERIIRIGRNNGIQQVFCIINSKEPELKHWLSTYNSEIPLKFIEKNGESPISSLFALVPFLPKEPFFLINTNSVFIESEFSEFITYSLLQKDADGILAVTRYIDDTKPLRVAMNDEDIILKFSDSMDGYSWANGGIYYFSSRAFDEAKYALQAGISGLENFLKLLIVKGYTLKGFSFSKIVNIKNAGDIARAEELIL
ncbi:MAG TPA: hypothetical protein VMT35_01575 [Ignavibacteriaceae bacterium]|nr:hypothetical protein [Ignavibacteriaceae bacterium]